MYKKKLVSEGKSLEQEHYTTTKNIGAQAKTLHQVRLFASG